MLFLLNPTATKYLFVQKKQSALPTLLSLDKSTATFAKAIENEPPRLDNMHLQGIEHSPPKKSLKNMQFSSCTLSNGSFRGTPLTNGTINRTALCLMDLSEILGKGLQIDKKSDLFCVNFSQAELKNASFSGNLEWLFFMGADLENADFTEATIGKGVFLIGANTKNMKAPSTVISSPEDLQEGINQGKFTQEELTFLHTCFQSAASAMQASFTSSSSLKPPHLTATHLDNVNKALMILNEAISLEKKSRMRPK